MLEAKRVGLMTCQLIPYAKSPSSRLLHQVLDGKALVACTALVAYKALVACTALVAYKALVACKAQVGREWVRTAALLFTAQLLCRATAW